MRTNALKKERKEKKMGGWGCFVTDAVLTSSVAYTAPLLTYKA
jgi:hypothetical protein